jgi:hypothetical protein
MDVRLGISRPSIPTFTLNNAVDSLLKAEFDLIRSSGAKHQLIEKYGIDAIPFDHPNLSIWRDDIRKYTGAQVLHQPTNLLVGGIIDDLWQDSKERLIIVDYKATSTTKAIDLNDQYKVAYKRQAEIYQWIFRQLAFEVSDTAYFVFANAKKDLDKFDGRLEFDMTIVTHQGQTDWVEPTLLEIKKTLDSDTIPTHPPGCEYCLYRKNSAETVARHRQS